MNLFPGPKGASCLVQVLVPTLFLTLAAATLAQPVIVSTVPANGATGVPVSASLVINFSEPMNTSLTQAYLVDGVSHTLLPTSSSWSGANMVLTCTPTAPLPASRLILWTVMNGLGISGQPLSGPTGGSFTTAAASSLIILTNTAWTPSAFSFDLISPPAQTVTVEYRTALASNQWQTLLTTNTSSGVVHISDPQASTQPRLFYRARTGS